MGVASALVVVSGGQCDEDLVRLACELLISNKDTLHILYVIEVERGLPVDAEVAPATAKGEDVLRHAEEVAKPYKCRTEAELVQARQAGSAVVQETVDKNVDVVVLGMPHQGRYGSLFLGEAVPYVLKNAPCRVIVWRDLAWKPSTNGCMP